MIVDLVALHFGESRENTVGESGLGVVVPHHLPFLQITLPFISIRVRHLGLVVVTVTDSAVEDWGYKIFVHAPVSLQATQTLQQVGPSANS